MSTHIRTAIRNAWVQRLIDSGAFVTVTPDHPHPFSESELPACRVACADTIVDSSLDQPSIYHRQLDIEMQLVVRGESVAQIDEHIAAIEIAMATPFSIGGVLLTPQLVGIALPEPDDEFSAHPHTRVRVLAQLIYFTSAASPDALL